MKKITVLFLVLFFPLSLLAQSPPGNVPGYTLWLEAGSYNEGLIHKKISSSEEAMRTHFNFNPVLRLDGSAKKYFRNLITERYSLFVVVKSDFEEERNVLTLNRGRNTIYVTNKALLNDLDMVYKQVNPRKGILLSYITNNTDKKGKKNNSLSIDEYFGDAEGKEQLMELIYYPKFLSAIERQKVETYLSLKYGTSILGEYNYISSAGKTIWDIKENADFNTRVTGIGRDDLLNLYQKQSGNAEKDGIYLGLGRVDTTNAHNPYKLNDGTFLLWGDNNLATHFEKDKHVKNVQIMKRLWKMQAHLESHPDSIATQVRIAKKEINYTNTAPGKEYLWLAVNNIGVGKFNYVSASYYMQSSEDAEYVYFNNIVWDRNKDGSDLFTFVKGPDFFLEYESAVSCVASAEGTLVVKVSGGTPPYQLRLESAGFDQEISVNGNYHEFTGLASGDYKITGSDSRERSESGSIALDPFANAGLTLLPVWYIDATGEVVVKPQLQADGKPLSLQWKKGTSVLSTAVQFTCREPGSYTLVTTTAAGCSKEIPFAVESLQSHGAAGWTVYPNPTERSAPFTVSFKLAKESKVAIRISSMEGKLVLEKDLGVIQHFDYQSSILNSGMYLITATIDEVPDTAKLIIH